MSSSTILWQLLICLSSGNKEQITFQLEPYVSVASYPSPVGLVAQVSEPPGKKDEFYEPNRRKEESSDIFWPLNVFRKFLIGAQVIQCVVFESTLGHIEMAYVMYFNGQS